jgi:SAM-dependent methyltransferase
MDGRRVPQRRCDKFVGLQRNGNTAVVEESDNLRHMTWPLDTEFGGIDIYLFDQLLRGRIRKGDRVFDAGCGSGRNLVYLLRNGFDVCGIDASAAAIDDVRRMSAELAPNVPPDHFRAEPLERCSFPDNCADVVISSAVLHFARDDEEFEAMLSGTWRLLRPGGLFFCRLASSIGIETQIRSAGRASRRHLLPDGSERYLVDAALLMDWTERLGGALLDPLKTTVVQDQRSMTTWVLEKSNS